MTRTLSKNISSRRPRFTAFAVVMAFVLMVLYLPNAAQAACPSAAAAQKGEASAEYLMGKAYDDGSCGLSINKMKALHWYKEAAAQGHMLAAYETGETYFVGDGLPTNFPVAKAWFLKAARQGHGPSALRLGFLCAEAHYKGVKVDDAAAEHWFTVAAKQNTGDARFRLGTFYMEYKQPPDYKQGAYWLKLAAQDGFAKGGGTLAMFDLGRFLLSPPAAAGIKPDKQKGIMWMTKAAEGGLLPAQMTLADMYSKGRDVPPDAAKAFQWVMRIATAPTAATFYLNRAGDAFFEGSQTVPKNYPAARRFYERAAARGDAHALRRLSKIYAQGLGVQKDAKKADDYLSRLPKHAKQD